MDRRLSSSGTLFIFSIVKKVPAASYARGRTHNLALGCSSRHLQSLHHFFPSAIGLSPVGYRHLRALNQISVIRSQGIVSSVLVSALARLHVAFGRHSSLHSFPHYQIARLGRLYELLGRSRLRTNRSFLNCSFISWVMIDTGIPTQNLKMLCKLMRRL